MSFSMRSHGTVTCTVFVPVLITQLHFFENRQADFLSYWEGKKQNNLFILRQKKNEVGCLFFKRIYIEQWRA